MSAAAPGAERPSGVLRAGAIAIGSVLATGFAWQLAVTASGVPAYLVPAPWAVVASLIENAGLVLRQAGVTLGAAALGLALSTMVASVVAAAFVMQPRLEQASMPLVIAFRSAPVAAVAPIIMLFLGRSIATSVMVVMIVSFFPLLVNLMRGLRAADRNAAELFALYDATPLQQLRMLRLPAALPYFFSGLRVAVATSFLGAMLSEWITGTPGLGKLILDTGVMRQTELLWGAVVVAVGMSLAVFAATGAVERRLLRWRA